MARKRNKIKIYTIILTNHGKELKKMGSEATESAIYKRFKKLLEESNKVVFPKQYNNHEHVMIESDYELVIIKCKEMGDNDINKVKDNFGRYVNYESSEKEWVIVDRANYNIEETFWVYGYHPRLQRKTFQWVFDNFILPDSKNKYMFKTVQVYNNKVLIDCNGKLDMVLCKNKSDSIRFYNKLEEWCVKKKMKYIAFMGDVRYGKCRNQWMDRIQELTSWPRNKIKRLSTRD